jgi:VanZ family protein
MPTDRLSDSLDTRPWRRHASPLARLACVAYLVLIVYASLAPWSGWRDLGVGAFAWLTAAWPTHVTRFDVVVNVLGYAPFGALAALALHPRVRGAVAVGVALACGLLLSGTIEALQTFVPRRVASNVDLLANGAGCLLGAALAAWRADSLIDRGRLLHLRDAWFGREASVPLVLLALWPLAQMVPMPMLFGLGPGDAALLESMREAGLAWLPARGAWAPTDFVLGEAVVTTAGLLSAGLTAATTMMARAPRVRILLALLAAALAAKALAYGLRFGPDQALAWLTPGAVGGLAVGLLALVAASWGPPRAVARLALTSTAGLLVAVALIPDNPYFSNWVVQWRTGRLEHFNALAEWIALGWPIAAIAWLAALEITRWPRQRRARADATLE